MEHIGEHGDIFIARGGCNPELGVHGLVEMPKKGDSYQEYIEQTGNHKIDTQLNIYPLGTLMVDGLNNTKEMAQLWNWKHDTHELNWRNKPVCLRIGYDNKSNILRIQVWNNLGTTWLKLKLSPLELDRIIDGANLHQNY